MNIEDMRVGEFLAMADVLSQKVPLSPRNRDLGLQIAILDRGFVYVGYCVLIDGECIIQKAKNVRRWGTTKGLGELVNGPTGETILDDVGTVRLGEKGVMHFIEAKEEKWKKIFNT